MHLPVLEGRYTMSYWYLVILRQPNVKKKLREQDIKNILSEKVGGI